MDPKRKISMKQILVLIITALFFASCRGNHDYSPKPRGYYRIIFPKKEYQQYNSGCPITFLYPNYAVIEPDKLAGAKPCWLNMQFPQFNGTLHLSYEHILSKKEFDELI